MSILEAIEKLRRRKHELESDDLLHEKMDEYEQVKKELEELEKKQEEEKTAQEQQEMRESFQLPRDYNEFFGVEGLNEEIHALVQQVMSQYEEFMNAKLSEQDERHRKEMLDEIRQKDQEIIQLKNKINELENLNEEKEKEITELKAALGSMETKYKEAKEAERQAREELQEMTQRRDNAAKEIESLHRQIDELEARLKESRPKTESKFVPKLTSNLQDRPIKSATELAMEGKRFRGKVELPKIEVPSQQKTFQTWNVDQADHDTGGTTGVSEVESGNVEGNQHEERTGDHRLGEKTEYVTRGEFENEMKMIHSALAALSKRTGGPITDQELEEELKVG